MVKKLALKIDVDTALGTRDGVPCLCELLTKYKIPATFLFSLGPDNTGKSIRRIFQPGFFKKIFRTRVTQLYGWKTLLYGTLLPAPQIALKYAEVIKEAQDLGFSVGIHAYDHFHWQNFVHTWSLNDVRQEFAKAINCFYKIFSHIPCSAGAPGWQANENTFQVYDEHKLLYASDCRGNHPFFPRIGAKTFKTLQIPTTLPTLDEWLGDPKFKNEDDIISSYLELLKPGLNVLTIHAEIEGGAKSSFFERLLKKLKSETICFTDLTLEAIEILKNKNQVPVCEVVQTEIEGRAGLLAVQDYEIKK